MLTPDMENQVISLVCGVLAPEFASIVKVRAIIKAT
jgi:hypothetical protein